LGALPLFFEERAGGRGPIDRLHLPISHDDPLDDDPTELLPSRRGGHGDRFGQRQDARPVGIEGQDPVTIR